jgi:hypothetical protein
MIPGSCYQTISAAYLAAGIGDTIKAVAMAFAETLNANRPISVTLQGGYAPNFTTATGFSTVQRLKVSSGTLNTAGVTMK